VDYALPVGTPVRASLAGRVVMAKEFGFMGKTIVIDHGYGLMTVYAHLKDIGVNVGQTIQHRQLIGKSGISGKSTGPLIHWKVVVSGVKVDPLSVLALMKNRMD
jgi:murein DD-endopeptidase MepM/ murein hydrolase activator NlpD